MIRGRVAAAALFGLVVLLGCGVEAESEPASRSGAADPGAERGEALISPEEAQQQADEEIDESNADEAFEELKREIEAD